MNDRIELTLQDGRWCAASGDIKTNYVAGYGATPLLALEMLQKELRDCTMGLTGFEETFRDCTIDAAMVKHESN